MRGTVFPSRESPVMRAGVAGARGDDVSNEIEITVNGWVAQRPRVVERAGGLQVLSMRIGSTPRKRDVTTGAWGNGPTQWFAVTAFRDLATNTAASLRKGDPVLVRGRFTSRQWEHEGRLYFSNEIAADSIGIELSCGTALFGRLKRWEPEHAATGGLDDGASASAGDDRGVEEDPSFGGSDPELDDAFAGIVSAGFGRDGTELDDEGSSPA
jgi:single-strand DNA-binding protein